METIKFNGVRCCSKFELLSLANSIEAIEPVSGRSPSSYLESAINSTPQKSIHVLSLQGQELD